MENIKFVVKVNRRDNHAVEYLKRIDKMPIQITTERDLALVMGRFTAEDAIKSIRNPRWSPELLPVKVIL